MVIKYTKRGIGWGQPQKSDTYSRFDVWPTHPSIYQNFLPRPIHLPKFLPIFTHEHDYLPKFDAQTRLSTIFCQFLLLNPSISTKIIRSNPSIYQNFTHFGKWPTHLSTSAFQNPPIYNEHTYPWKYASTPSG